MIHTAFQTSKDVAGLKKLYFSDPTRQLTLKAGDVLLRQHDYNDRLYLVLDGALTGYLKTEGGDDFEVFKSSKHMFVGVYSFFCYEHQSYLTLVAEEDTRLAYIDQAQRLEHEHEFASQFLPVIVHEIYLRQLLAQQLTEQRQAAITKLYESEKMATLGQLAAGLAHELNNAIGVLDRNTAWIANSLHHYLRHKKIQHIFSKGFEEGQLLTTAEIREKRKRLEHDYHLPAKLAKQLAKTTIPEQELAVLLKKHMDEWESINLIAEAGIVLHDMKVAASHAAHVVRSVHELGTTQQGRLEDVPLEDTLAKALALTKNLLKGVKVVQQKSCDAVVHAIPGDLVQVWINLIKNACESMALHPDGLTPTLFIAISDTGRYYQIIIRDNGPGIAPEVMTKIFQPNFTTKVNGLSFGLGVGLSIVKKIVARYAGDIRVESVPGETSFIIEFPKHV